MDVIHTHVCGLDVHKKNVVACIITPDHQEIRTFSTMTEDLLMLVDWIKAWRHSRGHGKYRFLLEANL